jgi:teichuronic acid biosynthesis glycosyltransferase TuaC
MSEKIRVLMITSEYPGVKRPHGVPFIPRQINALREAGIDVDVFHFNGKKKLSNYVKARHELRQYTAGKTFDLVHAQWGQSALLALPKRLPWVITFRGNDLEGIVAEGGKYTFHGRVQQTLSKAMARLANQIIVVSESLSRHLTRTDFHVIPSGLDFELFRPIPKREAREYLNLPKDKRLILFVARKNNPRKRFDLAEAAFNLIKDRYDAELIAAENVPHASIPFYMNACDALLLTSMHEGSPNVVKEALACNLPVVSTAIGDVPQRIGKIEGCAVVQNFTAEDVAAGLEKVLSYAGTIKGRESVSDLDEKIIARRVIEVYKKALQSAESKSKVFQVAAQDEESASRIMQQ